MRMSEEARAIRKKAQLARLATKTQPGYPALYASQPHQIAIAAEQGAERRLARSIRNQAQTAAIAAAESATSVFTGAALTDGNVDQAAE